MEIDNTENKQSSRRIWGWISAIVGGLFVFWGISWAVYSFYSYITIDPLYYDIIFQKRLITSMGVIISGPGLVIGVPLLILGIWLIGKRETSMTKSVSLNNVEVEDSE